MNTPTITIEDEQYPFLMGRGALRCYCRKQGLTETKMTDINQIFMDMNMDESDMLHWFCFKVACSGEGKKFPYSFEEFQEILDDHPHLIDEIDQVSDEQKPDVPEGNPPQAKKIS